MTEDIKNNRFVWTERLIGRCLARQIFNNKCLVVVPNCTWTGNECDILAVTQNLRIIDVEIKINMADLRADRKKEKWFAEWDWQHDFTLDGKRKRTPIQWPRRVWKHYYAIPETLWPQAAVHIQPMSGVLLLRAEYQSIKIVKRATSCRDAEKITAADAVNIARLASLRMWNAYKELDAEREKSLDTSIERV